MTLQALSSLKAFAERMPAAAAAATRAQVLRQDYDASADVWSAGVVLYILLAGHPPFGGKSDARILQRVQAGAYSFANREWDAVSEGAKRLISEMLVLDSRARGTAASLLQHAWLTSPPPRPPSPGSGGADAAAAEAAAAAAAAAGGDASAVPPAVLSAHMVRRLRAFANSSHMKRLALVVLARTLTERDVTRLRELFVALDRDRDGCISAADLHQALEQVGAAIGEAEMAELFRVSDLTGEGSIEYESFIAAMLDTNRVAARRDAVRRSFESLDRDGDGFISVHDLAQVLQDERPVMRGPTGRKRSLDMAATIVAEVDADHDGSVSYEDFQAMWQAQA